MLRLTFVLQRLTRTSDAYGPDWPTANGSSVGSLYNLVASLQADLRMTRISLTETQNSLIEALERERRRDPELQRLRKDKPGWTPRLQSRKIAISAYT